MFYLLETVLAPVWVWMIFSEVPTRNSMIGGTILIVALVAHSLWQLADGRRRTAASGGAAPAVAFSSDSARRVIVLVAADPQFHISHER